MTNKSAEWLTNQGRKLSPFGEQVADILGIVYRGIYHISSSVSDKTVAWNSDDWIEVKISGTVSTYDADELTKLVILCHDNCVRLEIRPAYQKLCLCFSPRQRDGTFYQIHPTIEQAIITVRKCKN